MLFSPQSTFLTLSRHVNLSFIHTTIIQPFAARGSYLRSEIVLLLLLYVLPFSPAIDFSILLVCFVFSRKLYDL